MGASLQLTGHSLEAIGHYKAYVRDADPRITAKDRESAKAHIDELAVKVGHVTIDAPAGAKVAVDGAELVGQAPFAEPVDVDIGKHALVAKLGDASKSVEVAPGAGETVAAKFTFEPVAVVPPGPGPGTPGTPPPPPEPPAHGGRSGAKLGTVIGLGGAAVVAAGVGIGFAVAAGKQSTRLSQDHQQIQGAGGDPNTFCATSPGSAPCPDEANAFAAHRTDIGLEAGFFVGAGVLAVAAIGAWVFWPHESKDGKVVWLVPSVTSSSATMGLAGRF